MPNATWRTPWLDATKDKLRRELLEIEEGHRVACLLRYPAERQAAMGISTAGDEDEQENTAP